jgi:hypothetical protein
VIRGGSEAGGRRWRRGEPGVLVPGSFFANYGVLGLIFVQGFCFPCCLGPFLSEFRLVWSDPGTSSPSPCPIHPVPVILAHFGIGARFREVSPNSVSNRAARSDLASLDSLVLGRFWSRLAGRSLSPLFFFNQCPPLLSFWSLLHPHGFRCTRLYNFFSVSSLNPSLSVCHLACWFTWRFFSLGALNSAA